MDHSFLFTIMDRCTLDDEMSAPTTPGSMVLLTRLSRSVYRRSTEALLGIKLKHYMTLLQLRDKGGNVAQQALGEAMHLDPNNLVLLLNDLESDGYVERRRDPDDRRRHVVEITDAGREALERAEQALDDLEEEVLEGLTPQERGTLRELLAKALADVPVQVSA
jgi:DNA-binding MarR family transcriptional regulator